MIALVIGQLLNGIIFGLVLGLVALGLSVILGLLQVVNLAHAAVFTTGAYVGFAIFNISGNFILAIAGALLAGMVTAFIMEVIFIRRVYGDPDGSMILTFGLLLMIVEIIKFTWGAAPQSAIIPRELSGSVSIVGTSFSIYRLAVGGMAIIILLAIWYFLRRTGAGLVTRAVLDNRELVETRGIRTSTILTSVFVVGSGVAALAGALGSPMFGVFPEVGTEILVFCFIAVVIGGVGNILGTTITCVMIGILLAFMTLISPAWAYVVLFSFAIVIMISRPQGLFRKSQQ